MKGNQPKTNDCQFRASAQNLGNGKAISASRHAQAKLNTGEINDSIDREADVAADTVMSAPDSISLQHTRITPSSPFFNRNSLGLQIAEPQENEEDLWEGNIPKIQSKLSFDAPALLPPDNNDISQSNNAFIQRIGAKREFQGKEHEIFRKKSEVVNPEVRNSFENYAVSPNNSSQPQFPSETKNFFEPKFNFDFSKVKIPTDSIMAKPAQRVNTLAYTSGKNIFLNSEQNNPNAGQIIMSHASGGVIQQKVDQCIQRQVPPALGPSISGVSAAISAANLAFNLLPDPQAGFNCTNLNFRYSRQQPGPLAPQRGTRTDWILHVDGQRGMGNSAALIELSLEYDGHNILNARTRKRGVMGYDGGRLGSTAAVTFSVVEASGANEPVTQAYLEFDGFNNPSGIGFQRFNGSIRVTGDGNIIPSGCRIIQGDGQVEELRNGYSVGWGNPIPSEVIR